MLGRVSGQGAKSTSSRTIQDQNESPQFSEEQLVHIFSVMSRNELVRVSLVCKQWKNVSRHVLERNLAVSSLGDETVDKTMSQVTDLHQSFSQLLDYHYNYYKSWSDIKKTEADESEDLLSVDFEFDMSYANVAFRGSYFCITGFVDVRVENGDNTYVLSSKNRVPLTHLAVDEEYVFGLNANGEIEQWNYKTGQHIRVMNTSYSLGQEEFNELRQEVLNDNTQTVAGRSGFFAKEGRLFLFYADAYAEIIEYQTQKHESKLITFDQESFSERIGIYVKGQLICFTTLNEKNLMLEMLNLTSLCFEGAYEIRIRWPFVTAVASEGNIIYAALSNKLICLDLESNKETIFSIHTQILGKRSVIESIAIFDTILVLYVRGYRRKNRIYILNRQDHRVIESMKVECAKGDYQLSSTIIERIISLSKEEDITDSSNKFNV